jgi:hypothetical protein
MASRAKRKFCCTSQAQHCSAGHEISPSWRHGLMWHEDLRSTLIQKGDMKEMSMEEHNGLCLFWVRFFLPLQPSSNLSKSSLWSVKSSHLTETLSIINAKFVNFNCIKTQTIRPSRCTENMTTNSVQRRAPSSANATHGVYIQNTKASSNYRYRNLVVSSLFVHDLIGSVDFWSMHQPQRTQCFHIGILLTEFAVRLLSSEVVGSATAFSCSRYEMTLLNWWIFSSFFSSTALALALCVAWRILIRWPSTSATS